MEQQGKPPPNKKFWVYTEYTEYKITLQNVQIADNIPR
jgi:hypothetical protein